jgi:hypothetical protein
MPLTASRAGWRAGAVFVQCLVVVEMRMQLPPPLGTALAGVLRRVVVLVR